MSKLVYDPTQATISYGFYVCSECKSSFYGGGRALHNTGCSIVGYFDCEYHFGDRHVKQVLEMAEKYGEKFDWYGINKNDLLAHFPELVK